MNYQRININIQDTQTKASLLSIGVLGMVLINLASCIEPYDAKLEEEFELLSIEGSVIKGEQIQYIIISGTTSLINPQFHPVQNCSVKILDNLNNEFLFQENSKGVYSLAIGDEYLVFNREYKMQVTLPSGNKYESEYEMLLRGALVDSVYYQFEEKLENISGSELNGLQFYIDIKAADSISRYYRWKLEETYEFTSIRPITYYLTGDPEDPIVFSQDKNEVFRCWKTLDIKGLFLSSTVNLTVNAKKRIPLNFVSTQTDRLKYKYSLLTKQYTLNEHAHDYWLKAKNETQENGGLYLQQPGRAISNIYNVKDSSEIVLGYFWVSHMSEKRIFVPRINSIPIDENCEIVEYDPRVHDEGPFPRYVYVDEILGMEVTSSKYCFNCTLKGGSLSPPDFWE